MHNDMPMKDISPRSGFGTGVQEWCMNNKVTVKNLCRKKLEGDKKCSVPYKDKEGKDSYVSMN